MNGERCEHGPRGVTPNPRIKHHRDDVAAQLVFCASERIQGKNSQVLEPSKSTTRCRAES